MTAPDIKQKPNPTEKSEYTKLLIIQIKNDQIFRLTQSKFIIKEIQNRNKSRPTLPPMSTCQDARLLPNFSKAATLKYKCKHKIPTLASKITFK